MTTRTVEKQSLKEDDGDSISLNSTQESEMDEERAYSVEKILAEQEDDEGNKFYLIRWEGYDLLASTWEPSENIEGQETFDEWDTEKMRVARGLAEQFDVAWFEKELGKLEEVKIERRERRRAKRTRLGISMSSSQSEAESATKEVYRDDSDSSSEAEEVNEAPDDFSGAATLRQRPARSLRPARTIIAARDESDVVNRTLRSDRSGKSHLKQKDEDSSQGNETDISDDSLVEELQLQYEKRIKKLEKPKKSSKVTGFAPDRSEPSSSHEASPLGQPRKPTRKKERLVAQAPSVTGYKGTANKAIGTPAATLRRHGAAATRGSTRGRGHGRGRTIGGMVSFTARHSAASGPPTEKRSLGNAILKALKSEPTKAKQHYTTTSMLRKAELAGRALADRVPDIASIGPLTKPSEYNSSRPIRKKSLVSIFSGPGKNSGLTTISQNSTLSVTPHQRLADYGDLLYQEEPTKPILTNKAAVDRSSEIAELTRRESQLQAEISARTAQLAKHPIKGFIQTSESRPAPLIDTNVPGGIVPDIQTKKLPEGTPIGPRELMIHRDQILATQQRFNSNDLQNTSQTLISAMDTNSILEELKQATMQPQKLVKKIKFNEYKSRRMSESFGNAISIQATFGDGEIPPLVVAFKDTDKQAQHPWIQTLCSLETASFDRACLAQDLRTQIEVLQNQFLASGDVLTDSNGGDILEEVAERLRPLLGIVFCYEHITILLFPTKCEEWKPLDTDPNVDQNSILRYRIYECPVNITSVNISKAPISATNPKASYLETLIKVTLGIEYQRLLPSQREVENIHNFYLMFPNRATSFATFITVWLRACNPKCRIFTNRREGSWDFFTNNPIFNTGAIIMHASLIPSIFKIPRVGRLIVNGTFNFWCMDDDSTTNILQPYPGNPEDIVTCTTKMVRLFPHGGALLLTPTFLSTQPERTFELLTWFKGKLANATPGTWKLVVPYYSRQFLLHLSLQSEPENEGRYKTSKESSHKRISKTRFRSYEILNSLMGEDNMEGYEYCLDGDECPIIFADENVDMNDEQGLVTWFAGWTMLHLDSFRKFIVIGTAPARIKPNSSTNENANPNTNIRHDLGTLSSAGSTETPSELLRAPQKEKMAPTMEAPPKVAIKGWKRDGFTEVMDLSKANLPTSAASTTKGSTEQEHSRKVNTIDHTVDVSILEFITVTGTDRLTAEDYVRKYNNDWHAAVQGYLHFSKKSTDRCMENQIYGAHDAAADLSMVHELIAGTDTSPQGSYFFPNVAHEDVRRAFELYSLGHDGSRSPSGGPPTYDGAGDMDMPQENRSLKRSGVVTDEDGVRRFVPRSVRPSGTIRPEISIRPGYEPPEDKSVYRNSRVIGGVPQYELEDIMSSRTGSNDSSAMQSPTDERGEVRRLSLPSKGNNPLDGDGPMIAGTTTEWYEKLRKDGQSWEHILVSGWETCFKYLRIKGK